MHPGLRPPATTGFDVSLLGFIVAAVGFYGGSLTASADATPNLVRFSEAGGGTRMPAAMPQDNALLLVSRSGSDAGSAGGSGLASLDPFWALLVLVGATIVVAGPVWAWMNV
jgi:hypothetical protein